MASSRRYVLVAFGVVAFAVSLAISFQMLIRDTQAVRDSLRNGNWIAAQLEVEYHLFLNALDRFGLGSPDVDHQMVMERFDIFWSRIDVVRQGPESELLRTDPGFLPVVESARQLVQWAEHRLEALKSGDRDQYQLVASRFRELQRPLHLAVQHSIVETESFFARERLNLAHAQLIASLLGVYATGALLIGLLLWELRRSRRLARSEREAKVRAEAASRAKSQFLANTSHELRTPLNAIIGFSEMMREQVYGPIGNVRYEGYIRDVHASAVHLLDIINTLLDMSKIEAGMAELCEEEVDVIALVESSTRFFLERAARKGVVLRAELPAAFPEVRADGRLLKQALLNMLSNAVKFTGAGGLVTVAMKIDDAERVVLLVRDTGIGMTSEGIQIALTPFGQVEDGHTRKYEGTGLGVPLAKGFAELHGGTFSIESAPGQGTSVTVTLPAERTIWCNAPAASEMAA